MISICDKKGLSKAGVHKTVKRRDFLQSRRFYMPDSRFSVARGTVPCSERSDAKHSGHSSVQGVQSYRARIRGLPRIEVRPLFKRNICETSLISFGLYFANSQNLFAIGDFFVSK